MPRKCTIVGFAVCTVVILLPLHVDAVAAKKPVKSVASSSMPTHASVDMVEVNRVWLSWINALRSRQKCGLKPYSQSNTLDRTALLWSTQAVTRGSISHKRPGQTAYYDYTIIKKWFADQGVTFTGKGTVFTESIGWGTYSCKEKDCTQKLIKSLRTTFDFYVREKGKKSRPHWNSMVSMQFTQLGVGIALDSVHGRYYVTTHYGTTIAE